MRVRFVPEPGALRQTADIVAEHALHLGREHGFELVGELEPCDIAVACGAHGAAAMAGGAPTASAWLVQDLDDRRGGIVPAEPWSSPLHPIAGARWIADLLGELRARPAPLIVRPGVDKGWLTPRSGRPSRSTSPYGC